MKLEKKHLEEAGKILKSIKEKLNEGPDLDYISSQQRSGNPTKMTAASQRAGLNLPDCNLHWDGIKMDRNGNTVVVLSMGSNRPFTIQTNGNLPLTHKSIKGVKGPRWISHTLLDPIRDEIVDYIQKYMPSVKSKLKVYEPAKSASYHVKYGKDGKANVKGIPFGSTHEGRSSKKTKLKESSDVAFYVWYGRNTKAKIMAKDLSDAKEKAIKMFRVPKSKTGLISVMSAKAYEKGDFQFH